MVTTSYGFSSKSVPLPTTRPFSMEREKISEIWPEVSVAEGSMIRRATSTRAVEATGSRPPACIMRSSTVEPCAYGKVPGRDTSPWMVRSPRSSSSPTLEMTIMSLRRSSMSGAAPARMAPRSRASTSRERSGFSRYSITRPVYASSWRPSALLIRSRMVKMSVPMA